MQNEALANVLGDRDDYNFKVMHPSSIGFCGRKNILSAGHLFPNGRVPKILPKSKGQNAPMLFGTLIHKLAPHIFYGKLDVATFLNILVQEGAKLPKKPIVAMTEEERSQTDTYLKLISDFTAQMNPYVEFEPTFQFEIEGLPFEAHIDILDRPKQRIIDLKTSGSYKPLTSPDSRYLYDAYMMQLHTYYLACVQHNIPITKLELWVIKKGAKKLEDLFEIISVEPSAVYVDMVKEKVKMMKSMPWMDISCDGIPSWECSNCRFEELCTGKVEFR